MKYLKLLIIPLLFLILVGCNNQEENQKAYQTFKVKLIEDNKVEEQTLPYGKALNNLPKLTKEGHKFLGWFYADEKELIPVNEYDIVNRDLELVAKFEAIKYNVTIYTNTENQVLTFKYNDPLIIPENLKRPSYNLVLIENGSGLKISEGEVIKNNLYLTLNYEYSDLNTERYLVSINFDNGSEPINFYVLPGEIINLPNIKKEGYVFNKYKNTDTNQFVTTSLKVENNLNLIATYKVIYHTIVFRSTPYGGEHINDIKVKHNETLLNRLPVFSKPGVKFLYWEDEAGNHIDENQKVTQNLTLRPVFEYLETKKDYLKYEIKNDEVTILGLANKDVKNLIIPKLIDNYPVKNIIDYAFANETQLKYVKIPSSISNYGQGIFYNCSSLSEVVLPENITRIPAQMFMNTALAKVNFPNSIEVIENEAFFNSTLTNIDLPLKLTTISDYAFFNNNLKSLVLPNNLISIGRQAFRKNKYLAKLDFNNNLKYLKEFAFSECYELREVSLPYTLEYLGKYAFAECSKLREITIYDQIKNISSYHFDDYQDLAVIHVIKTKNKLPYPYLWNYNRVGKGKHYDYTYK